MLLSLLSLLWGSRMGFSKSLGLVVLGMFLALTVNASEVLWLRLSADFSYRDITTICSTRSLLGYPQAVYFAAEVDNGKVVSASLRQSTSPTSDSVAFLTKDLRNIELLEDSAERLWLRSLPLSTAQLNWIFFRVSTGYFGCKPPQKLKSMSPLEHKYSFDTKFIGDPTFTSATELRRFGGVREDGRAYVIELGLSQVQARP